MVSKTKMSLEPGVNIDERLLSLSLFLDLIISSCSDRTGLVNGHLVKLTFFEIEPESAHRIVKPMCMMTFHCFFPEGSEAGDLLVKV